MAGFLEDLGKRAGPWVRRGRWWFRGLTGTESERLRAEEAVGRDLATALEAELALEPDDDVQRFATDVAAHLVAKLQGRRHFAVRVLAGGEGNAFALPGGRIYVDATLLQMTGYSAAPVAFVLGHEIAHVVREHAFQRLLAERALGLVGRVAPTPAVVGGWLRARGLELLHSTYSQTQEEEADRFGFRLARAAGFPATGAFDLLHLLERRTVTPGVLAQWFSSHPPIGRRLALLRETQRESESREAGGS